jgi:hypothetical protein
MPPLRGGRGGPKRALLNGYRIGAVHLSGWTVAGGVRAGLGSAILAAPRHRLASFAPFLSARAPTPPAAALGFAVIGPGIGFPRATNQRSWY